MVGCAQQGVMIARSRAMSYCEPCQSLTAAALNRRWRVPRGNFEGAAYYVSTSVSNVGVGAQYCKAYRQNADTLCNYSTSNMAESEVGTKPRCCGREPLFAPFFILNERYPMRNILKQWRSFPLRFQMSELVHSKTNHTGFTRCDLLFIEQKACCAARVRILSAPPNIKQSFAVTTGKL